MEEPRVKRVYTFVDGQNLYNHARTAFGISFPDYNPLTLCSAIVGLRIGDGWKLDTVHFYTGIHDPTVNPFWHGFWSRKLLVMQNRGVSTFSRVLRYTQLPSGHREGREKGIDVRIALDVLRLAFEQVYDVALVLSQDQDLTEVADEVRSIAIKQDRWLKVACAFPMSPKVKFRRGIDKTDWVHITEELYRSCIDPIDYRNPLRSE